jgi:hypothetical protein
VRQVDKSRKALGLDDCGIEIAPRWTAGFLFAVLVDGVAGGGGSGGPPAKVVIRDLRGSVLYEEGGYVDTNAAGLDVSRFAESIRTVGVEEFIAQRRRGEM